MRKEIRICGSGGQGVILLSVVLAHAYGLYEGFEVAQSQTYGPEARGGACHADVVISDEPIDYIHVEKADILIAMNQVGYSKFKDATEDNAMVFIDSSFFETVPDSTIAVNATDTARNELKPFAANIVMLGYVTARMSDLSIENVEKSLRSQLPEKLQDLNVKALWLGYEMGKKYGSV